jgi:hypothetical protein
MRAIVYFSYFWVRRLESRAGLLKFNSRIYHSLAVQQRQVIHQFALFVKLEQYQFLFLSDCGEKSLSYDEKNIKQHQYTSIKSLAIYHLEKNFLSSHILSVYLPI